MKIIKTIIALMCLILQLEACTRRIPKDCATKIGKEANDLSESQKPGVFHDLTKVEMKAVRRYLESSINLADPASATLTDPHIYTMMLEMPNKTVVLNHVDNGAPQPDRKARVVTFRGDLDPPVVQELVCGPLPDIDDCKVDLVVPFAHRPVESREYKLYDEYIMPQVHSKVGHILKESYGASLDYENCEDDCFNYWITPAGNELYGLNNVRKMWIYPMYNGEYYSMYPVDFGFLANIHGTDPSKFSVENVWYSGKLFENLDELAAAYNASTITKTKIDLPPMENEFSSLKPTGAMKPDWPQRPPEMVEPDGKRYVVKHRHISYLDMWSFHYRISPLYGPGIWDVRFMGDRIAYEISLMELLVMYSGNSPFISTLFFVDTNYLTGSRSKALVKGADCPTTATMLPKTVPSQGRKKPVTFPNFACVFEENTGRPLRRHHSYSRGEGAFYGGMADSALVVRSIHVIDNYDYIVEFKFHQNGALGVTVLSAGYILTNFYSSREQPYGFKLTDHMTGPIHIHAANFKVDLDIHGTSNRYETLDISEEEVDIESTNPRRKVSQIRFDSSLKRTEKTATYRYNFATPKYHIFHNNAAKNGHGVKKSYRLVNKAMTNMMVNEDFGNERSHAWTRYQMAVTKQKDSERVSSAPYNQWGPSTPAVDFQSWIDDDENIVDEDLVAWVTLGIHHIPHSEDLPTVATAGKEETFYLHPYNYFPVDPSMKSRDSVYMDHEDEENPEKGIWSMFPGDGHVGGPGGSCIYTPTNITELFMKNPNHLFETTEDNGVL